jgi:hypothetical protein
MHDIVFVEYLKRIKKLLEDEQSVFLGKASLLFKNTFKCAPITVLVDKVEIIRGFEHVDVFDDVLMLLDIGEDIDFVDGALL